MAIGLFKNDVKMGVRGELSSKNGEKSSKFILSIYICKT